MNLFNILKCFNPKASIIVILLLSTTSAIFAATIFGENFNSAWSTTSPPTGWRIFYTGTPSTNDWHRKDLNQPPWTANATPYACLIGDQITGDAPDSLISPVISCADYYDIALRCSTYFTHLIGAYRASLLGSTNGGATWDYEISNYFGQTVPPRLEIFDLSWATNQPLVRFAWVFEGNQAGLGQWSIDNMSVTGFTIHDTDVATVRIDLPRRFELPTTIAPRAKFMNIGDSNLVNVSVTCLIITLPDSITDYSVTNLIPVINSGDSIVHAFNPGWDARAGSYLAYFWCDVSGDGDRTNDTLTRIVTIGWKDELGYDDGYPVGDSSWIWERYGWGVKFTSDFQPALVESAKFHFSLPLDTLSTKFRLRICDDDGPAGGPGTPLYESGILTAVPGWNSIDLSLDSIAIWDSSFYLFFIQVEGKPLSPSLSTDTRRDTSVIYWACYDTSYARFEPAGDFMIRCVLNYQFEMPRPNSDDFRTVFIGSPEENLVVRPPNRIFTPKARVENWGDLPRINVPVVCSIISIASPTTSPYTSTRIVDLNPSADTIVIFDPWGPAFRGPSRITVRTLLPGDLDPTNDVKEETLYVHRSNFIGMDVSVYDYRWIDSDTTGGPTFSWIDANPPYIWNPLLTGDNQARWIPLDSSVGFPFRFYDTTYLGIWVSDNGWIRIGPDTGIAPPGYPDNTSIPDSLPPNNTIYAFWDDLVYGPDVGGGGIYFKKVGDPPNRKFIIIYDNVRRKGAENSDPISFEVLLHENGIITLQYNDVFCSDARYSYGRSATIGIEDTTSTLGLQYLYGEGAVSGSYPGNKLNAGRVIKIYPYKKDVSVFRKVAPKKYSLPGIVTPEFRLINYGTATINEPFWTYLWIGFTYYKSVQTNLTLEPGDSITITFQDTSLDLGRYTLKCTTALPGDQIGENDLITDSIYVQSWAQMEDIPLGLSRKKVKSGALTFDYDRGDAIYALKGGNDLEFFRYKLATEKWESLPPLPDSNTQTGKKKKAKAGTSICYGNRNIFAIKGGNTQEFYSYNIMLNTWTERCTIPQYIRLPGETRVLRKPKYGAALAFAPISGRVYLLSGNRSRQFLTYNPVNDSWSLLDDIPPGYPSKKVKAGGALTAAGDTIFAIKGANSDEFYAYIVSSDSWRVLSRLPIGYRNKKIRAGGCLTYYQGRVYCLKGGNTNEMWIYYQTRDSWVMGTPIPLGLKHKKVKRGAAFVTADSLLFALKGGNKQEFWVYGPELDTISSYSSVEISDGATGNLSKKKISFGLWIKPNPARNHIRLEYGITRQTRIRLEIYNVLGERVRTLVNEEKPIGEYVISWDRKAENGKVLPAGIYIAKLSQANQIKKIKLIIAK